MKPVACRFEEETLAAVLESRWPAHVDAELRAHVGGCPLCSEIASVAGAFSADREALVASAVIPEAGHVWWRSQLRARREAVATANLPITTVQVVAFAATMALLGACFGASSAWFQSAFASLRAMLTDFHVAEFAAQLAAPTAGHVGILLGLLFLVLLVPTALYFAFSRD